MPRVKRLRRRKWVLRAIKWSRQNMNIQIMNSGPVLFFPSAHSIFLSFDWFSTLLLFPLPGSRFPLSLFHVSSPMVPQKRRQVHPFRICFSLFSPISNGGFVRPGTYPLPATFRVAANHKRVKPVHTWKGQNIAKRI